MDETLYLDPCVEDLEEVREQEEDCESRLSYLAFKERMGLS